MANNYDNIDTNAKRIKLSSIEIDNLLINELNDDCLLDIFSYLSIVDVIQAEKVCKRWKRLCQQSWKAVESLEYENKKWKLEKKYFGEKIHEGMCMNNLTNILRSCGSFIKYFRMINLTPFEYSSKDCKSPLSIVAQFCKNLVEINIQTINSPSAIEICTLANNCKELKKISLGQFNEELEKDLSLLLNNNKKLTYFSLSHECGSNNMTGEFLEYISADTIEEIHIRRSEKAKPDYFISALKKFKHLQSFTYGPNGFFNDAFMETIGNTKSLIYLSTISGLYKFSNSINSLANLVNLEKLILNCNYQLQDDNLKNISNYCKQLELLEINFCHTITDRGIESISNLKKLKVLKMDGLYVTDGPIGNLPDSLEILTCFGCEKIKDNGVIKLIKKASNLKQLNVFLCSITNVTIKAANEVTSKRTNNIILEINIDETIMDSSEITEISPFLKIYK
ncbi:hypothetical protein PV327_009829 [Microctonus hyperodae]|uniref:F-box domain-containing protein n=1 Tax=Microctonus hyperodae TaxID=165561 RepID=A0AA39KG41_MICHY|nr:hypothetical protein PV327_009829 [Microctonus hyperodae]